MGSHDAASQVSWVRRRIEELTQKHLEEDEESLHAQLVKLEKRRDEYIILSSSQEKVLADPRASVYAKEWARRLLGKYKDSKESLEREIARKRSGLESEGESAVRQRRAREAAFYDVWRGLEPSSQIFVDFVDRRAGGDRRRLLALAPDGQFFAWLEPRNDTDSSVLIESPDQFTDEELGRIFEYEPSKELTIRRQS
jgi:hypothetical protein